MKQKQLQAVFMRLRKPKPPIENVSAEGQNDSCKLRKTEAILHFCGVRVIIDKVKLHVSVCVSVCVLSKRGRADFLL